MSRNRGLSVIFTVFFLSLACILMPSQAFAGVTTPTVYFTVAGNSHNGYALLSDISDGFLYGSSRVYGPSLPAGYYGGDVFICQTSTGQVVAQNSSYTTVASAGHQTSTTYNAPSGVTYNVFGNLKVYNPSTGAYVIKQTVHSPNLISRSAPMYETTNSGQTYGNLYQYAATGDYPDLLYAKASNGADGYISTADLEVLTPSTPEEAVALSEAEAEISIPVYDLNGAVVGSFVVAFDQGQEVACPQAA